MSHGTTIEAPTASAARQEERLKPGDSAIHERCWIVVPAYNEAGRIRAVLEKLVPLTPHIVVVDDGSSDGTSQEALRWPVWVVRHAFNLGQGAALQTGLQFALDHGAEYIATFDADGQHDPTDLPAMLRQLVAEEAEYALGSRFLGRAEGIPASRRIVLRLAILFTRLTSGVDLSDVHNGIRVMTRRGAEQLHITMNRMEHASQIIDQVSRSGLKFIEVPVTIRYTHETLFKGQKTSAAAKMGLKLLLEKIAQ